MTKKRSFLMALRKGKWAIASRGIAIVAMHGLCANAYAATVLPTGGQYIAGAGSISTAPKGVVVNQSSKTGIVNWQGFSIGSGNTVQFNNGSGATLNRVTGGNLSQIDGLLKATGSVYLINPQGIVVGAGGKIVTNGSFVGSTRDMNDSDFMNGKALHATGTSGGAVVNKGSITSLYGDTILVGSSVTNSGGVSAPNGTAGLAAGNDVLLRPVGGDARIAISGGKGNVTNTGTVEAAQAELAAAGGNVYALAGNSGGLVSATGSKTVDGHVWLTSGGTTEVSGAVKAANGNGTGGTIIATGKNVQINSTARISASGTTGGTVLIGGDMRGGHDPAAKRVSAAVANAQTTSVGNGAQISADGTQDAGGAVVIWSDDHTFFDGKISATGANGNGGDAEVSSHNILDFTGLVDLTSKYADMGTLLLDPNNLTISTGTTSNAGSSPNYVAGAATSVLKVSDLVTALNSANISVTASGTLTVSSAISWTGATTLSLTSGGELTVNAAVTGSNANSGLTLTSTGADVYLQTGTINVHTFTVTAATEIVNGQGTFTNASGIATLNAGTAAGVGDPLYGQFSFGGTITAGTLTINAQGWVYPGFTIKAGNLLVTGDGTFNLFSASTISQTTSANVIGTLAANVTGELNVSNNGNLVIGSVNGVNGVTAGTFHLTFPSAKTLTQTQPITATTMTLLGTGAGTYTLTNPGNNIANFGAKVATGALSLADNANFSIAGALADDNGNSLTNGIVATTLTLNSTGNVTQTGAISVTNLELLGTGGNYSLTNTSNSFTNFAANTGSIDVYRAGAFTVGTAGSTNGVTTTGAARLFSGNSFTISKPISAGGALTIGAATNIAVNANINGSTVALKPDTGGTGTGSVSFGAGIKATGSTVSIYANSVIDYTANVVGTLYSYLYISTLTALQNMQNNLSGSYALNKDLDASASASLNGGAGFSPIGTAANPFTGNFDGMGHTISGLTINRPTTDYVGLFGYSTGSIINVGLSGGSITGRSFVGGLAGVSSGAISGVYSSATIMGASEIGGLIGNMTGGSLLQAYDTGNVTATGDFVGGLVGDVDSGTIAQTYASGAVSGNGNNVGGLVGFNGGSVSSSYFDKTINASLSAIGRGTTTGATGLTSAQFTNASSFSGWTFGTGAGSTGWVIVDTDSTLNNAGGTTGGTRPMFLSEASTNGKINNAHQLQLMALNLAGSYTLGANIDMSETARSSGVWLSAGFVPVGYAATDGTSTLPADSNSTFAVTSANPFSGNFNGGGFTISNLTINRPTTDYVGLIGYAYNSAGNQIIKNVNMVGGSITGRDHVGSIMGGNRGFVDNLGNYVITYLNDTTSASSTSSATVSGRNFVGGLYGSVESDYSYFNTGAGTVSGNDYVGGVVGWINSSSGFNTDMRSSAVVSGRNNVGGMAGYFAASLSGLDYATGNVTATGDNVGGLFGYFYGTLSVNAAYATGIVTGNNNVGGFAGFNGGQITDVFATGAVFGVQNVGGLIGNNDGTTTGGYVDYSFASGIVHGVTNVGGLVGYNTNLIGAINATGGTYATGAVYGTTNVGGLVGSNVGDGSTTSGRINSSYSTGYVNGVTNVGGLVGNSAASGTGTYRGYVIGSYFDTETSGQSNALGTGTTGTSGIAVASMPKTTTQLQAALQTGFSSSTWGFVANSVLPYFKWLYTSAPQVVSGTAYTDRGATLSVGNLANLYVSGLTGTAATTAAAAVGSTGKNGYYYFLVPSGTFATAGKQVLVTTAGGSPGATFQEKTTASLSGLIIYGTYLKEQANSATTTLSALSADLVLATGGNAAATASLASLANLEIDTTATSFALDQAISTGTLVLSSTGNVTQSGKITASNLLLLGAGGNYALTESDNTIGTIAATTGTVNVADLPALTVGTVAGTTGVTTTGATTLTSAGDLTIASTAKVTAGANNNVVLSAAGNFINNRGSDAVNVSGTGRWVIYSSAPGTDVFGNLNSNNTAVWNSTIGTLAPAGVASGNRYVFAYQPTLTITTTDGTKVYGDTGNVSSNYTISGLSAGVTNAFLADSAASVFSGNPLVSSSGTDAAANVADGPFAINATQGTLTALNGYTLAFVNSGLLSVTARAITVTADDLSRLYGDANPAFTYQITSGNLVNGDGLSGSLTTTADAHSNVNQYDITQGSLTGGNNYAITFVNGTLDVKARVLNISADDLSRLYGNANPTLTYSVGGDGLVNGDTLSGSLTTTADAHSSVGQYAITRGGLTAGSNYTIDFTSGTLNVTARSLDISADDLSRLYGNANPTLTYSVGGDGLVNGDTLSGLLATSADSYSNVGQYDITQGSLTAGSNYTIDFTPGTLNITARALEISADDLSRLYGNANPTLTYTITGGDGLVNSDTLSGLLATTADAHSNVGQYEITQGGLTAGGNYTIDFTNGALDVTARALSISADDLSRLYGNANPTLTYTITGGDGLVNGDTLSGSLATTADAHSNVNDYAITQGGLTAGSNYTIDFTAGTLNVTARTLDISADDLSRLYGNANPALTYTITGGDGLVNGDTLSGLLATTANTHSNVNSYAITQGGLTAGDNYTIDFTNGALSVTARTLEISADDLSRLYGNTNPALTYTITGGDGLVNGDALSGLLATGANTHSNVGAYAITQGALTAGGNYTIDFTNGALSVTARTLTVTADDLSRIYGNNNPSLTYAISGDGLVNGDTLSGGLVTTASNASNVGNYAITQGTLAASSNYTMSYIGGTLNITARPLTITANDLSRLYGNANPALTYTVGGSGLVNEDTLTGALTTTANGTSGIGNYAITQGTLAASSNYAVTYVGGTLSVTPRSLTITANDLSRMYGNTNPALTYIVSGDGLVNGDTLSGGLATLAGATSNVGAYAIGQGSLAASENYTVHYVGGALTITARPITITAGDLSRLYGDANPALTYSVGGSGLVNGDTLSGALTTSAGAASNVGNYAIAQGSLAASSNYAVTYVGGTLAVTPRALTVTADDLSRIYGSANPALTYALGGDGLVNGDTLTGALTTTAGVHSNVGSYTITKGNLAASPNYVLTFASGTLAITPAALLITADDISALSLAAAHPTASYSGLVAGDTSSVVSGLQFGLFPITGNSQGYDVVPFGASAQNYAISYAGGLLTLTAQPPNTFTSPILPGGALGTLPNLVLTTALGSFSFSDVATAAVGGDPSIVLFEVGLPGDIGIFHQFVITDYSNATNDNDRLVAAAE